MNSCVAAQVFPAPQQGDPDRPAGLRKGDGHHEAVAAIVSGTAQNGDGPR